MMLKASPNKQNNQNKHEKKNVNTKYTKPTKWIELNWINYDGIEYAMGIHK